MKWINTVLCSLVLLVCSIRAQDVTPPPATFKTNDFPGIGPAVAVIWDATNASPNTTWFRQYTVNNGAIWEYPELLGQSNGVFTNDVFVGWQKFFFYLPQDTEFLTRAVPYDGFSPELAKAFVASLLPDPLQTKKAKGPRRK